jgi:hypothetical protein
MKKRMRKKISHPQQPTKSGLIIPSKRNNDYQQDHDLKELLWYIPKPQKTLAKELVLWLYPTLKTDRNVSSWIAKQEFWNSPLALRRAALFLELFDTLARRNNIHEVPGPNVKKLLSAIFAWFDRQEVADVVPAWQTKGSPPVRALLQAVDKRASKSHEGNDTVRGERPRKTS